MITINKPGSSQKPKRNYKFPSNRLININKINWERCKQLLEKDKGQLEVCCSKDNIVMQKELSPSKIHHGSEETGTKTANICNPEENTPAELSQRLAEGSGVLNLVSKYLKIRGESQQRMLKLNQTQKNKLNKTVNENQRQKIWNFVDQHFDFDNFEKSLNKSQSNNTVRERRSKTPQSFFQS